MKVHPDWKLGGTVTWRLSCRDPNLQNVPPSLKPLFRAAKGHLLLEADYSQIELRVLAALSQDRTLTEAFLTGEDVHRAAAARLYGISPEEVTNEQRARGKTLNFGIVYGLTSFGLEQKFGIPENEGKVLIRNYMDRLDGVARYIRSQHALVKKTGCVHSPYGRIRRLPEAQIKPEDTWAKKRYHHALNQAVNFPVQSGAAELTLNAMTRLVDLEGHGDYWHLVAQVHDSILVEIEEGEEKKIVRRVLNVMTEPVSWMEPIPIEVDAEIGTYWGQLSPIDGELR